MDPTTDMCGSRRRGYFRGQVIPGLLTPLEGELMLLERDQSGGISGLNLGQVWAAL